MTGAFLNTLKKILRDIHKWSSGKISYLNDIVDFLFRIYGLLLTMGVVLSKNNNLQERILNLNPIFLLALFIILVALTVLALIKFYKATLFIINSRIDENKIVEVLQDSGQEQLVVITKLVPSKIVVETLILEMTKQAKRWSKDSEISQAKLEIWIEKDKFRREIEIMFFSKRKQSALSLKTVNFKVNESKISLSQLRRFDSMPISPSFSYYPKWRKFLLRGIEYYETEMVNRDRVYLQLSNIGSDATIYIDPHSIPTKTFSLFLNDNKVSKDITRKDILFEV